jgi:hypothetical protein
VLSTVAAKQLSPQLFCYCSVQYSPAHTRHDHAAQQEVSSALLLCAAPRLTSALAVKCTDSLSACSALLLLVLLLLTAALP